MNEYFEPALRLHEYISRTHWDGRALEGPDVGIRFNLRIGRFIKSYLSVMTWRDKYYYLQAQGYWILANWELYVRTGGARFPQTAVSCAEHMLERQREDGAWDYPNPEWKGRVATAEGTWGSIGLLQTYRHTGDRSFLTGALRWYQFLVDEVGFQHIGDEASVNYFSNVPTSRVPNNSAFVLRFLAELADTTGDKSYLTHYNGLVTFMARAQKPGGEFPYMVQGATTSVKCWEHFQCYQYNAFQCLDLMRCYEVTRDPLLASIVRGCLNFLSTGVNSEGRVFYDCHNHYREVTYHGAALSATLANAGRLGFGGYEELAQRTLSYLLGRQEHIGTFPCSRRDYHILQDRRSYPRTLAMILFLMLLAAPVLESAHSLSHQ